MEGLQGSLQNGSAFEQGLQASHELQLSQFIAFIYRLTSSTFKLELLIRCY